VRAWQVVPWLAQPAVGALPVQSSSQEPVLAQREPEQAVQLPVPAEPELAPVPGLLPREQMVRTLMSEPPVPATPEPDKPSRRIGNSIRSTPEPDKPSRRLLKSNSFAPAMSEPDKPSHRIWNSIRSLPVPGRP
jgi:hypothetical protein